MARAVPQAGVLLLLWLLLCSFILLPAGQVRHAASAWQLARLPAPGHRLTQPPPPGCFPPGAVVLENDTETFEHERVSSELKKQIQSARLAKKLTQVGGGVGAGCGWWTGMGGGKPWLGWLGWRQLSEAPPACLPAWRAVGSCCSLHASRQLSVPLWRVSSQPADTLPPCLLVHPAIVSAGTAGADDQ